METFWQCFSVVTFGVLVLTATLWRLSAMSLREEHIRAEDYRRKWLQASGAEQYLESGPDHLYPHRRGK